MTLKEAHEIQRKELLLRITNRFWFMIMTELITVMALTIRNALHMS